MKPLRQTIPALLALALAVGPEAAAAADVPLPPPPPGMALRAAAPGRGFKVAVLGGFLSQGEVASPSLQVDVGLEATPATWKRVMLEWHLPVRMGRPAWEGALERTVVDPYYGSYAVVTGTTEDARWIVEAIPSGRLILPVAPGFALHVEAGLGLSQTVERHVEDELYVGRTDATTLVLAPVIRAAFGLTYRVGERIDLVMQPLALGHRVGTEDSSFSALWGLSYRL